MQKKHLISVFIVLILIGSMLAGCKSTPTQQVTMPSSDQLKTAYPELIQPGQLSSSGYPSEDAQTYLTMKQSELQPPTEAPETAEGTASISGLLYVPREELVLRNLQYYLVAAEGDNKDDVPQILVVGGIATRGDIVAETNEKGEIYLSNIPPGNYFLVSSPPNGITLAVKSTSDKTPLLIKLEANQRLPLGVVIVPGN